MERPKRKYKIDPRVSGLGKDLNEQCETLSIAIDAANNCVCIADPYVEDCPIIYVNRGFEQLTGYTFDEVAGRNCRFLHGEDKDQPGLHELRSALREERDTQVVIRNYRKDGSMFWNELYVSAVRDEAGSLVYFMGVQNDVTLRVQQEDELRAAVEAALQDASWFTSAIIERLAQARYKAPASNQIRVANLTKRELDVLELLSSGLSDEEIAAALRLAVQTVRNYVSRLYNKLEVNTRAKAVAWARDRGIVKRPR